MLVHIWLTVMCGWCFNSFGDATHANYAIPAILSLCAWHGNCVWSSGDAMRQRTPLHYPRLGSLGNKSLFARAKFCLEHYCLLIFAEQYCVAVVCLFFVKFASLPRVLNSVCVATISTYLKKCNKSMTATVFFGTNYQTQNTNRA